MHRFLLLTALAVALSACQTNSTVRDESSAVYRNLQGATLSLKTPLEVPAGRARVFVQAGEAVIGGSRLRGSFDQYRPHCAFEIDALHDEPFVIRPDNFRVTQVQHSLEKVVQANGVKMAGLLLVMGLDGIGAGGAHEGYHLWLSSQDQPAVRRISCYGAYADLPDLQAISLGEIRSALGKLAELQL